MGSGLNVTFNKDNKEPLILVCGGEIVEVRYKKGSKNNITLSVKASREVYMQQPYTLKKLKDVIENLQKENAEKDETIAKLRECVKYYADRRNWLSMTSPHVASKMNSDGEIVKGLGIWHGGRQARETLKELEGVKGE